MKSNHFKLTIVVMLSILLSLVVLSNAKSQTTVTSIEKGGFYQPDTSVQIFVEANSLNMTLSDLRKQVIFDVEETELQETITKLYKPRLRWANKSKDCMGFLKLMSPKQAIQTFKGYYVIHRGAYYYLCSDKPDSFCESCFQTSKTISVDDVQNKSNAFELKVLVQD